MAAFSFISIFALCEEIPTADILDRKTFIIKMLYEAAKYTQWVKTI